MTRPAGLIHRDSRPSAVDEFFPLLMENFIPAPSTMVRREALLPLLPIPSRFRFLDWYLTTGIAQAWECCYVDAVLADYRVHRGNMHRAMVSIAPAKPPACRFSIGCLPRMCAAKKRRDGGSACMRATT